MCGARYSAGERVLFDAEWPDDLDDHRDGYDAIGALLANPTWTAEQRLWAAVLAEALRNIVAPTSDVEPGERLSARRWVMSCSERFGGFRYCCRLLTLEPSAMLRQLAARTRDPFWVTG